MYTLYCSSLPAPAHCFSGLNGCSNSNVGYVDSVLFLCSCSAHVSRVSMNGFSNSNSEYKLRVGISMWTLYCSSVAESDSFLAFEWLGVAAEMAGRYFGAKHGRRCIYICICSMSESRSRQRAAIMTMKK